MNLTKRKVSCTFKRENSLEIQERIYPLSALAPNDWPLFLSVRNAAHPIPQGCALRLAS